MELWDYTLLREVLIGGTVIDLEDRYYSEKWKEMQADHPNHPLHYEPRNHLLH